MSMALQTIVTELKEPETQRNVIAGIIGIFNSAPMTAAATAAVIIVQWNLEHLAIKKIIIPGAKNIYSLHRISTTDTSNLRNTNFTPLSPPITSTAIRLADAGADVAEAALSLAEANIESVSQKGLLRTGFEFLFGG